MPTKFSDSTRIQSLLISAPAGTPVSSAAIASDTKARTGIAVQILWKFFSISRRVRRSTTGRPWGQTLE